MIRRKTVLPTNPTRSWAEKALSGLRWMLSPRLKTIRWSIQAMMPVRIEGPSTMKKKSPYDGPSCQSQIEADPQIQPIIDSIRQEPPDFIFPFGTSVAVSVAGRSVMGDSPFSDALFLSRPQKVPRLFLTVHMVPRSVCVFKGVLGSTVGGGMGRRGVLKLEHWNTRPCKDVIGARLRCGRLILLFCCTYIG